MMLRIAALKWLNFLELFKVFVFFSASTHRWGILRSHISILTVKPLSETRWESRVNAVRVLRYHVGEIYNMLVSLCQDNILGGVSGTKTRVEAQAIAGQLLNFEFVVGVIFWYNILFEINYTSKLLQDSSIDLAEAVKNLQKTKDFLWNYRSEKGFLEAVTDAKELAKQLDLEPQFPDATQIRIRKKKIMFNYES